MNSCPNARKIPRTLKRLMYNYSDLKTLKFAEGAVNLEALCAHGNNIINANGVRALRNLKYLELRNLAGSVKLAGSYNYYYIIILTNSQQIWYRGQQLQGYASKVTGSIPALCTFLKQNLLQYIYLQYIYYTYLPNRLSILTSQF
ncbi:Leucine-rich_repeat domain superfamily [Hexamita inflata]|uniref:Leucine-rich repeat domain superfamily n=1 Tax=Hexamita inflata TaxID=28002 RepID=A0AA86TPL0_9EUKA|nr:Leucine-rich repeat domain superfamily [Hexamita inflata]